MRKKEEKRVRYELVKGEDEREMFAYEEEERERNSTRKKKKERKREKKSICGMRMNVEGRMTFSEGERFEMI